MNSYLIRGADRNTGIKSSIIINAKNEEQALQKANDKGILVSEIELSNKVKRAADLNIEAISDLDKFITICIDVTYVITSLAGMIGFVIGTLTTIFFTVASIHGIAISDVERTTTGFEGVLLGIIIIFTSIFFTAIYCVIFRIERNTRH